MKKNIVIFSLLYVTFCSQVLLAMQQLSTIDTPIHYEHINDEITFTHAVDGQKHFYNAYHKDTWSGTIIWQGKHIRAFEVESEERKKGIGAQLFLYALAHIQHEGYKEARWYARESAAYYIRFGARICSISTIDSRSAHMYFNFEKHGDPLKNLEQFKKRFISWKKI